MTEKKVKLSYQEAQYFIDQFSLPGDNFIECYAATQVLKIVDEHVSLFIAADENGDQKVTAKELQKIHQKTSEFPIRDLAIFEALIRKFSSGGTSKKSDEKHDKKSDKKHDKKKKSDKKHGKDKKHKQSKGYLDAFEFIKLSLALSQAEAFYRAIFIDRSMDNKPLTDDLLYQVQIALD